MQSDALPPLAHCSPPCCSSNSPHCKCLRALPFAILSGRPSPRFPHGCPLLSFRSWLKAVRPSLKKISSKIATPFSQYPHHTQFLSSLFALFFSLSNLLDFTYYLFHSLSLPTGIRLHESRGFSVFHSMLHPQS